MDTHMSLPRTDRHNCIDVDLPKTLEKIKKDPLVVQQVSANCKVLLYLLFKGLLKRSFKRAYKGGLKRMSLKSFGNFCSYHNYNVTKPPSLDFT